MIARLYDALHDPKRKDKLLLPTDTGNGGMTHAFFKAPKTLAGSARRPRRDRRMGASSPMAGSAARPTTRRRFWRRSAPMPISMRRTRTMPSAGTSSARSACRSSTTPSSIRRSIATGRRTKSATSACHVEKETDAGIVVSGAKVVATGSVLTNYTFVAHHGLIPVQDKKFAVVFMMPTNAPGVKFICRTSYEMTSTVMGSPFDYPLSSRARRERRRLHHGQGAGALGERVRLRRRREGQQFLPAHRLPAALRRARLHAARGQARLHRRVCC